MKHRKFRRQKAFDAMSGKCAYCGTPLDPDTFHIDHATPQSRGGSNGVANCIASCPGCNLSKGRRTLEEWHIRLAEAPRTALDTTIDSMAKIQMRSCVSTPKTYYHILALLEKARAELCDLSFSFWVEEQ